MVLPVLESSIAELCCDMFIFFFRSITGCLCDSSEGSNFSKSGKIQSLDENILDSKRLPENVVWRNIHQVTEQQGAVVLVKSTSTKDRERFVSDSQNLVVDHYRLL